MDWDHAADLQSVPQVEGAGERSEHCPDLAEVKDGEYSVCFERMGMGDLEAVEVVDVEEEVVATTTQAQKQEVTTPKPPSSVSYCYLEYTPSEFSDDDDDDIDTQLERQTAVPIPEYRQILTIDDGDGDIDQLELQLASPIPEDDAEVYPEDPQCSGIQGYCGFGIQPLLPTSQSSKCSQTGDGADPLARSRLSIQNVSVISLPPAQARMAWPEHPADLYDDVNVEEEGVNDDEEEEDAVSRRAPTPDNTPEHSPSGELQIGLGMGVRIEPGSTLYTTLTDMALLDESYSGDSTPTPEATPEGSVVVGRPGSGQQLQQLQQQQSASSGGALGRVWSRLLGRTSKTRTEAAPSSPPTLKRQQMDTEDSGDEHRVVEVDPQTIDELEATLEEVRLDGDADDPVVSYLVEEVEDSVRVPGTTSREVTVEEVHDDEEDEDLSPPAPRPSGLLSRLFSKSRMSQDLSDSEPVRRGRGCGAPKKGKTDSATRDRALHMHRFKPRQTNKASLRSSLPRCLTRWLRQGEGGSWGAEGDAGAAESVVGGVSPRLGPRALPTLRSPPPRPSQPPALQRTRRALNNAGHAAPFLTSLELEDDEQCSVTKSTEEKLLADFGSQTDSSIETATPLLHKESRGVEAVLNVTLPNVSDGYDDCYCEIQKSLDKVTLC